MNGNNIGRQISEALTAFTHRPLADAAIAMFDALGYHSEKRLEFPSLPHFLEQFDSAGSYAKRFADVRSAAGRLPVRMFQLTGDEIAVGSGGQLQLLSGNATDLRLFDTYLFLAIALPDQAHTRTELAERARALNSLFRQPVLVLFRYSEFISLAITYRRAHKRDQSRDVLDRKVTLIKDIRCSQPHRAHLEILADFALPSLSTPQTPVQTFAQLDDAWRKALSTQALNHRFYTELAAWYYWAVNTVRLPIIADHLKERKDAKDENVKQFTIRLLCRTIFCWFLKERGLIDRRLLELADDAGQDVILVRQPAKASEFKAANSYYRGILQNIFFNCLNTPMDQRRLSAARAASDKTVKDPRTKKLAYRGKQHLPDDFDYDLFDRIPYLNGGLFDVLPEDNASDTIDDDALHVPNALFYATDHKYKHDKKTLAVKGLNRILDGYKFTIAENTPLEEEVALDPELLGLVFENLLAEVDTSDEAAATSARRASGTYYTPRRVIDYMVNEALRLHLENYVRARAATPEECRALQELLYHDAFDPAQKRLAGWVVEAFDEIRILDPACGSGAFPMGALHRMVAILQRVDPQNRRWLHRQVSHIPDRHLRERAEQDLVRHADDYSRKLGLIKNAVYGVDIQPLAVLITKLRFFISLLVDQNINLGEPKNNYGLTPLPNLETKVLCANTLREVQVSLFEREAVRKYQAARDEYYQPETHAARREELAEEIAAALSDLLPGFSLEVTGHEYKDKRTQDLRNRELLKEWFRHSTLPAPFFNFAVFFPEICADVPAATVGGELPLVNEAQDQQELVVQGRKAPASPRSGFDIVIGNPPYGGNKIPDEVRESLCLASKDPYGAFIARFMRDGKQSTPLRIGGVLTYIVSDTFMTIKSHRPLREQLMGSRIHKMIRVHRDTFSATVNTAIILLQKGGGPGSKPPTDAELDEAWDIGPRCQMVDLTQVSIRDQHDRFLTLLFDTAGAGTRRDIATESCAVYHYPQSLIATNSGYPLFIASPQLFAFLNDVTARREDGTVYGRNLQLRLIPFGVHEIRVVKLDQLASVKHGLTTGNTQKFIFKTSAHESGGYRIADPGQVLSRSEMEALTEQERWHGFDPKRFGGKTLVPYDKGGRSDTDEGWLPRYYLETGYYIDWSKQAVTAMKAFPGFRHDGKEFYFRPGITFSHTGIYSPTFRVNACSVFDTAGSCLFPPADAVTPLLGVLNSRLVLYLFKNYINHSVNTSEDPLKEIPIIVPLPQALCTILDRLKERQLGDQVYDYASHEQLEIDRLVYEAYGLHATDIAEVETWYARRYPPVVVAQRRNLRAAGKVPNFDRWCVYCDESAHLPYDGAPAMVLAALAAPQSRLAEMNDAIKKLKQAHGWPKWREAKWSKVSPGGQPFYEALVDFFVSQTDLRFSALVAPKAPVSAVPEGEAGAEHRHAHNDWYYDRYFELLADGIKPPEHFRIYVDVKDTRGSDRMRELRRRLADAHYDFSQQVVEDVQLIRSHDVQLDQLCDLLLGCVSHALRRDAGRFTSQAKAALIARLEAGVGHPLLAEELSPISRWRVWRSTIASPSV